MTFTGLAIDAFGTVCRIQAPTAPYRFLAQHVAKPREFLEAVLTQELSPSDLEAWLAPEFLEAQGLSSFRSMLRQELESISLFEDAVPSLSTLRRKGIPIVLISNLASPYVDRLRELLSHVVDCFVLSCDVGLAKPDPRIFRIACRAIETDPEATLMVGNSLRSDVLGAEAAALSAMQLVRERPRDNALQSLSQLTAIFG